MKNNKRTKFILIITAITVLIAACSPKSTVISPQPAQPEANIQVQQEEQTVSDMPSAADTAIYTITFNATWSTASHPDAYVSSAHFSPFIAYAHKNNTDSRMYTPSLPSSPGMKQMAETGATSILEQELSTIISTGNALTYVRGGVFNSPGTDSSELQFTQEFNHFSFVSMIAPSPDWFVAVEALLFVDGQWLDELTLDLVSYDAGTDSGSELTSADADTNPKQPITLFPPYLQGLGTVTLSRITTDS